MKHESKSMKRRRVLVPLLLFSAIISFPITANKVHQRLQSQPSRQEIHWLHDAHFENAKGIGIRRPEIKSVIGKKD